MRGMDYIIVLRKSGYRPAHVVLDTMDYDRELLPNWLQVEASDVPELADLRPLIGLTVTVSLPTQRQSERWARAVLAAKAHTVLVAPVQGDGRIARLEGQDQ